MKPSPGMARAGCHKASASASPGLTLLLLLTTLEVGFGAAKVHVREKPGRMIQKERDVRYKSATAPEVPAPVLQPLGFDDALRTLSLSRATVRLNDQSQLRLRELSRLEIRHRAVDTNAVLIRLQEGEIYALSRGKPVGIPIETPQIGTTPRGTEFLVRVDAQANTTVVTMFDGEATLSDGQTSNTVHSGEQAIAVAGQGIVVQSLLQATNLVQWWIYYPGVLNLDEAGLAAPDQTTLRASLDAYRSGDLIRALAQYPGYPAPATPASDVQRTYLAALFLAVGAVDKAETLLGQVDSTAPPARALGLLIQAVRRDDVRPADSPLLRVVRLPTPTSASELLALSYAHQSTNNLRAALEAARAATTRSTNFGFAWTRVAELEFSFGHARAARQAVERALQFTPTNAQAHALRGFLLAAENRIAPAIEAFDRAIVIDPALGNAWLGRGLCQRKAGWFTPRAQPSTLESQLSTPPWLSDLQTAAALEPQRALSRSYAGKAFADIGDARLARKELDYARALDTNDPTSWLYSALLNQQDNRVNEAAEDLEKSIELNDNRAVYRSRLLLDQDRAVRGANLASVYRDAGMSDVSYREAARAVNTDYANYSAHLFLANSYSELLNYTPQVNLRYETPRVNEYLVATLLAPVGAGVLSPTVSQQEYSQLFERDRLGVTSTTEYLSRGAWTESGAQFGTIRNFGYSLDAYYRWDPGQRTNNDQEITSLSLRAKQQFGPKDSVFLQVIDTRMEYGDLAQDYDPNWANPLSRTRETQEPILLAGYHHEWSPQSHTLLLAGRLQDTVHYDNPRQPSLILDPYPVPSANYLAVGQDYELDTEIYTAEVQHILQQERVALIVGGRYQGGHFDVWNSNDLTNSGIPPSQVSNPVQDFRSDFERFTAYGYAHWQVAAPLRLIAGVAYDRLTYPVNLRSTPLSTGDDTTDQVSPKGGLIFTPAKDTVFRAGYGQSLGGVSLDQSFQLEPSQVAGFNQAWRSLIPESVTASSPAEQCETAGASLEQKFPTRTYLAVGGDWLHSEVDRVRGAYEVPLVPPDPAYAYYPSSTREQLDFTERTLTVTLNQLVGQEWAFGARYRLSHAELDDVFPDVGIGYGSFRPQQELSATLQQVNLFALYNHRCGFFAQFDSLWTTQDNDGYEPELPGDDFWQFNLWAGYRFPRRQAEVRLGVLNLTGQDYRLNPLNLTSELPRERTFFTSLRLSF